MIWSVRYTPLTWLYWWRHQLPPFVEGFHWWKFQLHTMCGSRDSRGVGGVHPPSTNHVCKMRSTYEGLISYFYRHTCYYKNEIHLAYFYDQPFTSSWIARENSCFHDLLGFTWEHMWLTWFYQRTNLSC